MAMAQSLGCTKENITDCQATCEVMYFGEKEYYRLETDECEAVVECGGLVQGKHTYERDA